MTKFALLGHNISYSLSPVIHQALYAHYGVSATYELLSVAPDELRQTVETLKRAYAGFNVTKPYKIDILPYLDTDNSGIGSVNTVSVEDGRLTGYTTDGYGFMRHLQMCYGSPAGKRCIVLGAGGVARIIVPELVKAGADVCIYNRTAARGAELAAACGAHVFTDEKPQLIVNCTSFGLQKGENPLPNVDLSRLEFAYDTIYSPPVTDFMQTCAKVAPTENGLGMLILQAIKADEIFLKIDTMSDIQILYEEIKEAVQNEIAGA